MSSIGASSIIVCCNVVDVALVHHLHPLDEVETLPEDHLEMFHVAQHLLDHLLELLRLLTPPHLE